MYQQSDIAVVDRGRSIIHRFSAVLSDWSSEVVVVWSAADSASLDKRKMLPWQPQIFLKHRWAKQGSQTPTDLSWASLHMLFWCPEDRLQLWHATGKEGIVSWTLIHRDLFAFITKRKKKKDGWFSVQICFTGGETQQSGLWFAHSFAKVEAQNKWNFTTTFSQLLQN